jgi:FkbM family methyltransferase
MLKQFIEGRNRAIAWEYMKQASKQNAARYPQMVCYSFDHIAQYINFDGRYENRELAYILDQLTPHIAGRTVLDIGANIGNHTVAFASKAKQVFALEPHPRNFQLLSINASQYANVKAFNLGASDKQQTLDAVSPSGNMGASSITPDARLHNPADKVVAFPLIALDDMPEITEQDIGFVKIDVEGHELAALKGMQSILKKQMPLIVLEQHADEISNGTSPVVELLKENGYQHFYELAPPRGWRTPGSLPSPIRMPMKLVEQFVFGPPSDSPKLNPVTTLEQRSYFMLFASPAPLSI